MKMAQDEMLEITQLVDIGVVMCTVDTLVVLILVKIIFMFHKVPILVNDFLSAHKKM
jgi:hypothetical protein